MKPLLSAGASFFAFMNLSNQFGGDNPRSGPGPDPRPPVTVASINPRQDRPGRRGVQLLRRRDRYRSVSAVQSPVTACRDPRLVRDHAKNQDPSQPEP